MRTDEVCNMFVHHMVHMGPAVRQAEPVESQSVVGATLHQLVVLLALGEMDGSIGEDRRLQDQEDRQLQDWRLQGTRHLMVPYQAPF